MLILSLLLFLINAAHALSYYTTLNYNDGKFSLLDITLSNASAPPVSQGNEFDVKLISFSGKSLFETSFNREELATYGLPIGKSVAGTSVYSEKKTTTIVLPYFGNAKKMQISKNGTVLLEIDVGNFAVCNENGICDGTETFKTCPGDCTCGDNICEANENSIICPLDCKPLQQQGSFDFGALIIGILIVILVLLGLYRFHRMLKKKGISK